MYQRPAPSERASGQGYLISSCRHLFAAAGQAGRWRFDPLEAAAGRLTKPLAVSGDGVDVRQRVLHDVGERAKDRVVERREPVMDPQALPPRLDEARAPEVREVPRHGRLRQFQRVVDLADADLAADQQREDT